MDRQSRSIRGVPPELQSLYEAADRVLRAGIHLMLNGYGRMTVLPCLGGAGDWRCRFHVAGRSSRVLYEYTQRSAFRFLAGHSGGSVRKDITPEALAKAILVSVPLQLLRQCEGELPPAERGRVDGFVSRLDEIPGIPVAHHEFSEDTSLWEYRVLPHWAAPPLRIAPLPGYVQPGLELTESRAPFWLAHEAAWDGLSRERLVAVDPSKLDDNGALDEIAERAWQEAISTDEWNVPEWFRRALRSALVALQPQVD